MNHTEGNRVSRRKFLTVSGLALGAGVAGWRGYAGSPGMGGAAGTAPAGYTGNSGSGGFPHRDLPYAPDALEPYIDPRTMDIHHARHHAAYVNNLNQALEPYPEIRSKALPVILGDLASLPDDIRTTVRNNGGGHYNHELFWNVMSPDGGGEPTGKLAEALARDFGDFASFQDAFSSAAAGVFGSGWAWLIHREDGTLAVTATPNQDNPFMEGVVEVTGAPLLGLDVWEHAYYLRYQNRRGDYIQAWWNVVNWPFIQRQYDLITR